MRKIHKNSLDIESLSRSTAQKLARCFSPGQISEVLPFREKYVEQKNAEYLMTFPGIS